MKNFLTMTLNADPLKKNNKGAFLFSLKDLAEGAERQATGQAKGFTNSTGNTSLISRTHRELLQLDRKKTNNPTRKWERQTCPQRRYRDGKQAHRDVCYHGASANQEHEGPRHTRRSS